MTTLFEIGDEITALHDLLNETGGDITDEEAEKAIDQWLSDNQLALEQKVDSYCFLRQEFRARADARMAEAQRLMKLAGTDAKNASRLEARLKLFFELHGFQKLETPRFKVSIQKNGGAAPLIVPDEWEQDPASAPEAFQRRVIQLDRDAIREAIRNDEEAPGCSIAPRGTHLRIR